MSNTATIKVAYVNPPKTPKGPGSIKDDTGTYYKVWKDLLPEFTAGRQYSIEYDTEEYNGKEKRVARKILSSSETTSTNGSNGHAPTGGASTDKQILWQVCLKATATMLAGTGQLPSDFIGYARELFAATPEASVTAEETQEVEI